MSKELKNLLNRLSGNARTSIVYARYISKLLKSDEIAPIHLALGIFLNKNSLATRTLTTAGINVDPVISDFVGNKKIDIAKVDKTFIGKFTFGLQTKEILQKAFAIASKMSHVYVGSEHILMALLGDNSLDLVGKFKELGLTGKAFKESLMNFAVYPAGLIAQPEVPQGMVEQEAHLSMLGHDLVIEALDGAFDPLVGRDDELRQVINILSRRRKNNPVIVGEPGVGKTALVEGLAQMIAENKVPPSLQGMRLIEIDIPAIMASSKLRGDVEEKIMAIIAEVVNSSDVILFIDEIHNILGSGIPGVGLDIASVLKPALVRDDFRVIGATTSDEYTKYFEEDNALARRFQPLQLEEPTIDETIEILHRVEPLLEKHHNVDITEDSIVAAVKLSDRYVVDRFLPDKAIDLLDEAAASKRLDLEVKYGESADLERAMDKAKNRQEKAVLAGDMDVANRWAKKVEKIESQLKLIEGKKSRSRRAKKYIVDVDSVHDVVAKWTGIPVSTISSKESETLLGLSKKLGRAVIGQDEAVDVVSSAIKRARAGISVADRPWASLLFLGPTGVGKTELAKALTKALFGNEDHLIQIDMSEMMEMHSISKLVGSPPGYVGYREGGQLTEQVRKNPHSVILFDEIEKAHPDILNILLQIMEYGHLTDGKGRKVNFKNTVVLLTSNIGAEEIGRDRVLGFAGGDEDSVRSSGDKDFDSAYDAMKDELMKELKLKLRPELLNRLDNIVIFKALSEVDAKKIVKLLLEDLNERLTDRNISVELTPKALDFVVKEGFSTEYGARPLRRVLQSKVETLLADYLLKNAGKSTENVVVKIDAKGGLFVVE